MSKSYKDYSIYFLDEASKSGLRYPFGRLFSFIPAGVAHVLDTLLVGLDGKIHKPKENHFNGPLGLICGAPPLLVGMAIGFILQVLFNIPSAVGHNFIDKPIAVLLHGKRGKYKKNSLLLPPIVFLPFVATFGIPPKELETIFGFLLGAIPYMVAYVFIRISNLCVSPFSWAVDRLCDKIFDLYRHLPWYNPTEHTTQDNLARDNNTTGQARKPRLKRPPGKDPQPATASEPMRLAGQAITQQLDLFAALGLQPSPALTPRRVESVFRKIAVTCHPDKSQSENSKKQWAEISLAKTVLSDSGAASYYFNNGSTIFTRPAPSSTSANDGRGPRAKITRPS